MLRIDWVDVDAHIRDKIEVKHGISFEEVLEACFSRGRRIRRARSGTYKLYGLTDAGRPRFVILTPSGGGVWIVVTARDMMPNDRRQYGRK